MAGDTQRAGEVAKAFGALSPELQKALQPIRRMLEEMFGRCDASAVYRGDSIFEGDTSSTYGPQTSLKIQELNQTTGKIETTEISWGDILTTVQGGSGGAGGGSDWVVGIAEAGTKTDSDGDPGAVNDRWPVLVVAYGGMNPGSTMYVYDAGMLDATGARQTFTGLKSWIWASKASDGRYYATNQISY